MVEVAEILTNGNNKAIKEKVNALKERMDYYDNYNGGGKFSSYAHEYYKHLPTIIKGVELALIKSSGSSNKKKHSNKEMTEFAKHCMMELVTQYPNGKDNMGEVSSYDLFRIETILKGYKTKK